MSVLDNLDHLSAWLFVPIGMAGTALGVWVATRVEKPIVPPDHFEPYNDREELERWKTRTAERAKTALDAAHHHDHYEWFDPEIGRTGNGR